MQNVNQVLPGDVADPFQRRRRVHDVGKQHGGEDSLLGPSSAVLAAQPLVHSTITQGSSPTTHASWPGGIS